MKRIVLVALVAFVPAAWALCGDLDAGMQVGSSTETPNPLWVKGLAGFEAEAGQLEILGHLGFRTDGVYGGFMGGGYGYGNVALETVDGGFIYTGDSISASLGKLEMRDIVDSPYSLVLSSRNNKALTASVDFRSGRFFYNDRWIALSYDLKNTYAGTDWSWPNRSAVVKNWGVELGSFRVALQDVVIFTGPNSQSPAFDPEYFLFPLPGFFVQYIGYDEEAPWKKNDGNDNSLTGIMVDWTGDGWYAVGQVLVDDINMNRFLNPGGTQNPDKIAWELGVRHETDLGTFGLFHAGATKYTFEPYGNDSENTMYGYTFSPDVEYEVDGEPMALQPEDNYVGYLHGENNIAFMGTWRRKFSTWTAASSLELTISGSKSSANPWGKLLSWRDGSSGTKLLDDDRLEKKIVLAGSAAKPFGNLDLGAELKLGWVWDKLDLVDGTGGNLNGLGYFYPSADSSPIAELVIGAKYHVPF